jgi:hypothetical protein
MRFFFPALRKKGEGRGEVTSAGKGVPEDALWRLQARGNHEMVSPPEQKLFQQGRKHIIDNNFLTI